MIYSFHDHSSPLNALSKIDGINVDKPNPLLPPPAGGGAPTRAVGVGCNEVSHLSSNAGTHDATRSTRSTYRIIMYRHQVIHKIRKVIQTETHDGRNLLRRLAS